MDDNTTIIEKKRERTPLKTESEIYTFLKTIPTYISFNDMQKSLDFTVGKLQAAVFRCLKPGAKYPIFHSYIRSKKTNRIIKIFSLDPSKLPEPEDSMELSMLISGKIISVENDTKKILPLKIATETVKILSNLVNLTSKYKSIGQLFSEAIMEYLNSIPNELIVEAMKSRESVDLNKIEDVNVIKDVHDMEDKNL